MTPNRRTDYFVYPVSGQPFIGWTDIVKPEIAVKVPNDVAGVIGHITELFFTLVQLVECPPANRATGPPGSEGYEPPVSVSSPARPFLCRLADVPE